MNTRRFPPPWLIEEGETYFVVKDANGQKLGYVYFDDPRAADKPLTRDEARRCGEYRQAAGAIAEVRSRIYAVLRAKTAKPAGQGGKTDGFDFCRPRRGMAGVVEDEAASTPNLTSPNN
jgi:hypothetical protein